MQQSCQSTGDESLRAPLARTLHGAPCLHISTARASAVVRFPPKVIYTPAFLNTPYCAHACFFFLSELPRRSDAPPTRHPAPLCRIHPHIWTRRSSSFKDIMKSTLFRKHPHPSPRRPRTQHTHMSPIRCRDGDRPSVSLSLSPPSLSSISIHQCAPPEHRTNP